MNDGTQGAAVDFSDVDTDTAAPSDAARTCLQPTTEEGDKKGVGVTATTRENSSPAEQRQASQSEKCPTRRGREVARGRAALDPPLVS